MQRSIQKWIGTAARELVWGLACLILLGGAIAQAAPASAVKLGLVVNTRNEPSGVTAEVVVSLLDPQNRAVKAATDVPVSVQPSANSGLQKLQLVIRAGNSSASSTVPISVGGKIEFHASARGLRSAAAVTRVRVGNGAAPPARNAANQPEPPRADYRAGREASRVGATANEISTATSDVTGAAKKLGELIGGSKSGQNAAILDGPTDQRYLADGIDAATFQVSLTEPAKKKTEIHLTTSSGQLDPQTVVFKQGEGSREVKLTSDQSGTFNVRITGVPKEVTNTMNVLAFRFVPPIVGLGARAVPDKISLFETAQVRVELQDAKQQPLKTDESRAVSISLLEGKAHLESSSQSFQPNSFEARFVVKPTAVGRLKLEARVDELPGAVCELQVTWPMLLLSCSGLGGALGGLLAVFGHTLPPALRQIQWYRRFRYVPVWRMSVGLITGFVFYWALLFLPFSTVPSGVLLNPFSSAVCSMLGGWVGLEVFSLVLKVIKPGAALAADSARPQPRRKAEPATS